MPGYEVLDTRPEPQRGSGRRVVFLAALALVLVGGLLLAGLPGDEDDPDRACRQEQGAAWCTRPSATMTDAAIVRLVHGYCPGLRALRLEEVVPQPLTEVGLPGRHGEVVLRTTNAGARVESGLVGQPAQLAWLVRVTPGGGPWQLQVVCHDVADPVPALELDEAQLRAALRADAGARGLDLREVARLTARAVHVSQGSRVSLGTFRCRTTPRVLALAAGARFTCSLPLYSDQGQAVHRVRYATTTASPFLRPMS